MGYKDDGCWASALDDEMRFVLLARDPEAPNIVRQWALQSKWRQPAEWIAEAFAAADEMERWGRERYPEKWAAKAAYDADTARRIRARLNEVRVPKFGDMVLTRWSSVDPDGTVHDKIRNGVVVQVLYTDDETGDTALSITQEHGGGGAFGRWRQLVPGGRTVSIGWCWQHDGSLPVVADAPSLADDEERALTKARRRRAEHDADVAAGGPGHLIPWAEAKRLIDEEAPADG